MFNRRALAVAAGIVLSIAASTANAGSLTLGGDDGDYRAGTGGEFAVTAYSDAASLPAVGHNPRSDAIFHTFCMERLNDQGINLSGTYDYTIADFSSAWTGADGKATAVGVGTETTRALDTHTAWLYTEFWYGRLGDYTADTSDDYDYSPGTGRAASAEALQKAMWYFQTSTGSYGEQYGYSAIGTLAQKYVDMAVAAVAATSWSGIGNVRILQLVDSDGVTKQDVVTMVPLPPAALAGLGLLGGLGLIRLRRRRAWHGR